MYESFHGLSGKPFSLTPDPRYVFHSERYRSALEHLRYGLVEKEGFLLLTGMVGTGKTTLCRELLGGLDARRYRTALVFNPFLGATEMLQALLSEFGCTYPPGASRKELYDRLNRYLLSQLVEGYTCVAVFDEAQHLSHEFLEQVRVLSNLETEREKLLQIVLVGQPELRDRIQEPGLAQLDQRVSIRCVLSDLDREETERYVHHRLNVAGGRGGVRFTRRALDRVHRASHGVPRLVNLVCDRALLAGYVARTRTIGAGEVAQGIASLRGEKGRDRAPRLGAGRLARLLPAPLRAAAAILAALWSAGAAP